MKKTLCWFFCLMAATSFAEWTSTAATDGKSGTLENSENGIVLSVTYGSGKTITISGVKNLNGHTVLDLSEAVDITITQGATVYSGRSILGLGNSCFQNQTALTEFIPPPTLESIGGNAFRDSKGIVLIDFSKTRLTTIGTYMVYGSDIETVIFPESLVSIGANFALKNTKFKCLEPKTLPNLTTIGGTAFKESGLTGDYAFPSLTELGDSAFAGSAVTSVDLSSAQIKSVPSTCFDACASLTQVRLPSTVVKFGDQCFRNCPLVSAPDPLLSPLVTAVGKTAFYNDAMVSGDLVISNPSFNFLTSGGGNEFRGCDLTSIDFTGVTGGLFLTQYCFYGNKNLKKVVLPACEVAFYTNGHVFRECPKIEEFYFRGPPSPTMTENALFYNCLSDLTAKFYVPKGDADWNLFLTTNTDNKVSWVTAALTSAEKEAFAAKWPGERVPTKKVKPTDSLHYQYLCRWWPNGAPGLTIILR